MEPTIIVALITVAGVIISAIITKENLHSSITSELDKQQALINQKLDSVDEHLREHNHYAKLFSENVPVIQEQIKVINHRLEDLERKTNENKQ